MEHGQASAGVEAQAQGDHVAAALPGDCAIKGMDTEEVLWDFVMEKSSRSGRKANILRFERKMLSLGVKLQQISVWERIHRS